MSMNFHHLSGMLMLQWHFNTPVTFLRVSISPPQFITPKAITISPSPVEKAVEIRM